MNEWLAAASEALAIEAAAIERCAGRLDGALLNVVGLILEPGGKAVVTGVGKSGHIAKRLFGRTGGARALAARLSFPPVRHPGQDGLPARRPPRTSAAATRAGSLADARDVMTASPVTIGPEASLAEAVERMERRASQISVLPVVDGTGCALGLLRLHDVFLGAPPR